MIVRWCKSDFSLFLISLSTTSTSLQFSPNQFLRQSRKTGKNPRPKSNHGSSAESEWLSRLWASLITNHLGKPDALCYSSFPFSPSNQIFLSKNRALHCSRPILITPAARTASCSRGHLLLSPAPSARRRPAPQPVRRLSFPSLSRRPPPSAGILPPQPHLRLFLP